jgi:hypothetical protein
VQGLGFRVWALSGPGDEPKSPPLSAGGSVLLKIVGPYFAKVISPKGIHLKSFRLKELEPFVASRGNGSNEIRAHDFQ